MGKIGERKKGRKVGGKGRKKLEKEKKGSGKKREKSGLCQGSNDTR